MKDAIRESDLRAVLNALASARFWLARARDETERKDYRLQIRRLEAERERLTVMRRRVKR